jgi:hypothetical protein
MANATSPADFERNLMYGGNPGAETGTADAGKRRTPPPPGRKAPESDGPTSSQVVVLEGMGRDKEKKGA